MSYLPSMPGGKKSMWQNQELHDPADLEEEQDFVN